MLKAPESLHSAVSLYLFVDCPPSFVGSSWPATCVPALTQGLAPPPALNLLVARVTETQVYALQFEPSQKDQFLVVPQLERSGPNQHIIQPLFLPGASKLAFCPEN